MALRKHVRSGDPARIVMKPLNFPSKVPENAQLASPQSSPPAEPVVDVDLREVYFLIMHFLSDGPCHRTFGQLWNELLEHQLLPRRYHSWYSRSGEKSSDENDDGMSYPLNYTKLVERYPHIAKDHLVQLLKQLLISKASPSRGAGGGNAPNAADVPTLLGTGSFSLLRYDRESDDVKHPSLSMRWPHRHADQVRGLTLREIGGGFTRHHRAPSIRAACYAIAKPSTMVQKMQNIKRIRGHRNAVYCAMFDRLGRYVITGSDDRLVKIWSMETAYCLASCRGHEGDITDLAVSSNNAFVASSSNDCIIRVWRLADGLPVSVLRGHIGAVTAIAFSPRPGSPYQLLSSSDDGTCRIWDARNSQITPRIYVPKPLEPGKNNGPSSSNAQQIHQIFCCAFNANGTVFVTGSSDTLARVWNACKSSTEDSDQPNYEIDVLAGHENDVNYVQFSGCAAGSRFSVADCSTEENVPKFRNSWFSQDNIVTCSRDGSAIIWIPKSRRQHGRSCRWARAYHLKVPSPPMPPQPPRGGPRQRILPTPRGVNMIVWSLDNRFVLAAIMDCRICVWNAADGSLVHSLTGHTASTYVLDVHPFNPRIAMSAGYDGKTIVWDIWEGIPIKIYEISHFKLVDGKFSPDGTSIILSDDVGQLYILSTGQGESQNDAKYDQFYLGDYRPLIHDTHGNVLDQETQITPYRRNMEDPLCDSAMIPYEEPYQTIFQQRRLGALGREWRPSSLKVAIGPDITLDQDYQMAPLADLDIVPDPLPEFLDIMDWQPEIESNDTDSEYNVTEDNSAEGDQGSLTSSSSGDLVSSAEDSDDVDDGLRRSKRKNMKSEVEVKTLSGRRVKRRNLDEFDGTATPSNRSRKLRNGKKASKNSSKLKLSRPRRAAARNALSWFSKLSGTSKEEDVDESEGDFSEGETTMQSGSDSEESDKSFSSEQSKHLKGKEILMNDTEDTDMYHEHLESHNRKRLVLKFPVRGSNKLELPMMVGSSSNGHLADDAGDTDTFDAKGLGSPIGNLNYRSDGKRKWPQDKFEDQFDLSIGYDNSNIKWGGVKLRSTKRMRSGETVLRDTLNHKDNDNSLNEHAKPEDDCNKIETDTLWAGTSAGLEEGLDNEQPARSKCSNLNHLPRETDVATEDTTAPLDCLDLKNSLPPLSTKLRLRTKRISRDPESPLKLGSKSLAGEQANGLFNVPQCGSLDIPKHGESSKIVDLRELEARDVGTSSSSLADSGRSRLNSQKMFDVVYKRSKLHKKKNNSEVDGGGMRESNQNCCDDNDWTEAILLRGTTDAVAKTLSHGVKELISNNSNQLQESDESYRNGEDNSANQGQTRTEWGSSSRAPVGIRSTRNRRSSYQFGDSSPVQKKVSQKSLGNGSWLMLSVHEEGPRYIPQIADDIVYMRQGHQEYLSFSGLREAGPWTFMKEEIRAVEFCKVEALEYSTLPGSGDSCCKLGLKFVDLSSKVCHKSFTLTMPEVVSFPDFLVEKSRYDASTERNWTCRDKCKVWWTNDAEEDGGSWWEGRIMSVKPKCLEFPDSPWERYTVKYKSEPTETHLHSPWELFDADTQWERPRIDDGARNKLLEAFARLEQSCKKGQDPYGVQKFKQVLHKSSFTNRFPVPLTLELIHSRLENNYYRSLEALKHDVSVMLSYTESYFVKNAELKRKIARLSEWFAKTLSSL